MSQFDERLDYYLMLTRLMGEADAQLEVESAGPERHAYAADLDALREAIIAAEEAAARIVIQLVSAKQTPGVSAEARVLRPARH